MTPVPALPPADRLQALLAAALLAGAALLPPEIHPVSAVLCTVLLGSAAIVLAVLPTAGGVRPPAWLPLLAPIGLAAILACSCRARAVDQTAALLLLVLAALLGGRAGRTAEGRRTLALTFVTLGCAAAILALLQRFVTYPALDRALRAAASEGAGAALVRLQAGRPTGPFSLPAALGGFLAITLPITLAAGAVARAGRGAAGRRGAILAATALQGYALFLTRSFGALGAATLGLLLLLPRLAPAASRRRLLAAGLLLLLLAAGGWFLHARRAEIGARPGGDPLSLRAGNWSAAMRMMADHPLLGVGPGSFGTAYTRYLRPGMNETRYAHDSYLQAAAEWGLWILAPLAGLLASFGAALRSSRRRADAALPFLAGAAAFLVHNLVDFTAYLPGVAIPASLALGLGLGAAGDGGAPAVRRRTAPIAWRAGSATLLAGLLIALALGQARALLLMQRAGRAGGAEDRGGTIVAMMNRAIEARRWDPEPHAFLAQWVLAHGMDRPDLRSRGRTAAERAVRLDREAAILHYTRALYDRADGVPAAAYREADTAHRLYPLKPLYREALAAAERGRP
jgi:O-Antigen ligase